MNNNLIKLIMCAGIFFGTNFGMQKEHTIISIPQINLYVERDSRWGFYQGIEKDGCVYDLDDTTLNVLTSSKRFNGGSIIRSKDWKYHVQGRLDYASHVAVRRENSVKDTPLSLNSSDFRVPITLTEDQVKRIVQYRRENRIVFVTDQHNARLDIESISVDDVKKEEVVRLEQQKSYDDDACNERCLQSCEACCVSALLPMGSAVVLTALRIYQAIND